jgi:hypothetical protein
MEWLEKKQVTLNNEGNVTYDKHSFLLRSFKAVTFLRHSFYGGFVALNT